MAWKAIKNIERGVLLSASITALTTGTNVQYATIPLSTFSGVKSQVALTLDGSFVFNKSWVETASVIDTVGNSYKFSTDATNLYVGFPLGTYADISACRTDLTVTNPTNFIYQLATPIIIEEEDFADYGIEVVGTLRSLPNYTENYADNYNIFPPITISYPVNITKGLSSATQLADSAYSLAQTLNYPNSNYIAITTGFASGYSGEISISNKGIVNVRIDVAKSTDIISSEVVIYTLPLGYRPRKTVRQLVNLLNTSDVSVAGSFAMIEINTLGEIKIVPVTSTTLTNARNVKNLSMTYYTV